MPAAITTPGPIYLFAAPNVPGQSPQFQFLGTAIVAPEPKNEKNRIEVMNDLGGRSVPFQLVKDGERWKIGFTTNKFDLALCQRLRALDGGGAPLGSETGTARGTLVIGVSDFQLIMVNTYAGTPAANNPVLNNARQFFSCSLFGYEESTAGSRTLDVSMAIIADNVFNPTTRGFSCYTEVVPNAAALLAGATFAGA